ncbi:MAG: acetylxylan esterase [Planctomycetales bacterium]|nr:acetylxylan esterase [Planctomycetales bacterium]
MHLLTRSSRSLLPLIGLLFAGQHATLVAQEKVATSEHSGVQFDLDALAKTPEVFSADDKQIQGVRAFYYAGPTYQGKPTRIFAYYGVPAHPAGANAGQHKFPAMVLIHGGGGTAFERWVKLWNSRGYAAIAMDLCGCVPVRTDGNWQRHEFGGPPGWDASFSQLDDTLHDQWTFHAVSAVALGHSLIRAYPEVDADRIGVTGISWGGYLTSIVAGVDHRFKFAVPVYGCGYLGDNSVWLPSFERLGPEKSALWLKQWDPAQYLGAVRMPMLWVNGTNDFAYPMDSWKKSWMLPKSSQTLCLRIRMPHGHGPAGENPEEISVYADSHLKQGKPLATITEHGTRDNEVWATFVSKVPLLNAELCFTRSTGRWQDREWEILPAHIDAVASRVTANMPADATVYYLNIFDDRQCAVSTEHTTRP